MLGIVHIGGDDAPRGAVTAQEFKPAPPAEGDALMLMIRRVKRKSISRMWEASRIGREGMALERFRRRRCRVL